MKENHLIYPTDFLCNAQWLKPLEMPIKRDVVLTSFEQKFVGFGSCFAINLKSVLTNFNFDFWWNRDVCAHYSTATLLQTLRRAVGLEPHREDEILEVDGNPEDIILINYFKIRFFGPDAREKAKAARDALDVELIRNIQSGDIFIVTLGNTKVSRPKNRETVACTVYGLKHGDYDFVPQSVDEVEQDLHQILDIFLKVRGGRPLKLFVSVSPQRYLYSRYAELCSTLEDNCLMKSTLRIAVNRFTNGRKNDGAIYFPSFEMVIDELRLYETLSTYDHLHINQDFTPRYVVKKFLRNHASEGLLANFPLIECYRELVDETNLNVSRGASPKHPEIVANWQNFFTRMIEASEQLVPMKLWFSALHMVRKLDLLDEIQVLFRDKKVSPAVEKVVDDWTRYLVT